MCVFFHVLGTTTTPVASTAAAGSRTLTNAAFVEEFKILRKNCGGWGNPLATEYLTASRLLHNVQSTSSTEDAGKHMHAVKTAFPSLTSTDAALASKNPYSGEFKACVSRDADPAFGEISAGIGALLTATKINTVIPQSSYHVYGTFS